MIKYKQGNILESNTKALVNTVNCQGYMGKGIAYQFKLKFPQNNLEYIKQCNKNLLKIGDILLFEENNKIILNFPTKDNWRKKSNYEFIKKGLKTLKHTIIKNKIKSISIPPLGCGNGGLEWNKVKFLIESNLEEISDNVDITIYEPIYKTTFENTVKQAPKLSSSHLLLMQIKINLNKFNKLRLQKSAFLNNIISNQNYFKFKAQNFGPYAHSIDILSRDIKEYQKHHGIDTKQAFEQAYKVLISKNFNSKLNSFNYSLSKTIQIVNNIKDDSKLELITTILYIVLNNQELNEHKIIQEVTSWNDHKKKSFNKNSISDEINNLLKLGLLKKTLYDTFEINKTAIRNKTLN